MYLTTVGPMMTLPGFEASPKDDSGALYSVNAIERTLGGRYYKVGVCGNCVAITTDLDNFVHAIADTEDSSLFRELTLAGCIDVAVVVDGVSVFPCRNDIAALYLARYFADLIDCAFSFCR